ncbi:MAG TPA: ATP-binding cassette domain-containing protein, partial [Myxococcaceae bacterium]|nr:ATP-binding cassette domain-containing protein [Myxococcaceae bacterium]
MARRALWLLWLLPLLVPLLFHNPYWVHGVFCRVLVYAILVASLDLLVGYVGDVSIGHAGFFAIGAYAVAALTAPPSLNSDSSLAAFAQWPPWAAFIPAVLLAAAAGLVLGFPSLRSSGPYLAVITIAYGLIIGTVINESESLTNGTRGITLAPPRLGGLSLSGGYFVWVAYPALLLTFWLVRNLTRSFRGRALEALKYSAVAAECCGVSRATSKVTAFVLSAALAGFAGGLFVQLDAYVGPTTFSYSFSVMLLIALIFGGVRSLWGNVLGAAVVVVLPDVFSQFADYRLMVYGSLLLVVLFLLPGGLAGALAAPLRRWRKVDLLAQGEELAQASAGIDPLGPAAAGGDADALRLESVTMRFGGLTVIDGLSMRLEPGRVLGLIGPNGSGKSTTVNLLSGVYFPAGGRIALFGHDVTRLVAHRRAARGLARTFQNLQLFGGLTVLENVLVGLHLSFRSRLWEVLLG